jgi:hypothetical protein
MLRQSRLSIDPFSGKIIVGGKPPVIIIQDITPETEEMLKKIEEEDYNHGEPISE